jgi:hypothetical protein
MIRLKYPAVFGGLSLPLVGARVLFAGILAFPLFASAQTPSPSEVEQARKIIESGAPITPEMINAAKAQYPDLRKYSDAEVQRIVAERRQDGAASTSNASPETEAASESVTPGVKTPKGSAEAQSTVANDTVKPKSVGTFPPGLKRFGDDFFGNVDAAGLGSGAPALAEYVLSPGDEIQVSTWGRESRSAVVPINNEGMFHYPPLAPMRLAGMRFESAQKLVIGEIEKIHGVTASVSMGRLRSIRIMVLGEAVRPGSFVVPAGATVTSHASGPPRCARRLMGCACASSKSSMP